MKKTIHFLVFGAIALTFVVVASCSDSKDNLLEPQAAASESDITLVGSDQQVLVARSEAEMADSIYADLVRMYEDSGKEYDPEVIRRLADFQAKALLGTPIYLSEYEVSSLPNTQDPQYGYMTLSTPLGTFYFLLPHCICGYVVPEEKYFGNDEVQFLTCGCTDTLL